VIERKLVKKVGPLVVVLAALSVGVSWALHFERDGGSEPAEGSAVSDMKGAAEAEVDTSTNEQAAGGLPEAADASEGPSHVHPGLRAIEFFLSTQAACDAHAARFGNEPPRLERFRAPQFLRVLDDGRVVIADGLGTELIVDLRSSPAETIYSVEGPTAVLPRDLSFGCSPELYLGSAAD
jgi:hypothetical protein